MTEWNVIDHEGIVIGTVFANSHAMAMQIVDLAFLPGSVLMVQALGCLTSECSI